MRNTTISYDENKYFSSIFHKFFPILSILIKLFPRATPKKKKKYFSQIFFLILLLVTKDTDLRKLFPRSIRLSLAEENGACCSKITLSLSNCGSHTPTKIITIERTTFACSSRVLLLSLSHPLFRPREFVCRVKGTPCGDRPR